MKLLHSFEKLSDFTKIVLLDLVFPEVLGHINQFISVTNFVFNENSFSITPFNYYIITMKNC